MLRIVAGELRGRRIPVPRIAGVRPTGERVREALFSILGDAVAGAFVLDAYAGSGALGFEALSRGAARVVFVEAAPRAVTAIRESAHALGVEGRCRVVRGRVLESVGRGAVRGPFGLILADPPWSLGEGPEIVRRVGGGSSEAGSSLLAEQGCLVVERSSRDEPIPSGGGLERFRTARYGDTALDFFGPGSGNHSES